MTTFLIIAAIVGMAIAYAAKNRDEILEILQPNSEKPESGRETTQSQLYRVRKSIMTPAELKFHRTLMKAVPEAPIMPKMRMADVIDTLPGSHITAFRKISQKHFDWVICHPVSLEPLLAIELDDSSHNWSPRQRKNDLVKNEITKVAGLELYRINWQREYDEFKVRDDIAIIINRIADRKESATP